MSIRTHGVRPSFTNNTIPRYQLIEQVQSPALLLVTVHSGLNLNLSRKSSSHGLSLWDAIVVLSRHEPAWCVTAVKVIYTCMNTVPLPLILNKSICLFE